MMNRHCFIVLLLVCTGICSINCDSNDNDIVIGCPEKCVCRRINDNADSLDVKCGGLPQTKLSSIRDIIFDPIKFDVVQL